MPRPNENFVVHYHGFVFNVGEPSESVIVDSLLGERSERLEEDTAKVFQALCSIVGQQAPNGCIQRMASFPQQPDRVSCGVFVCLLADFVKGGNNYRNFCGDQVSQEKLLHWRDENNSRLISNVQLDDEKNMVGLFVVIWFLQKLRQEQELAFETASGHGSLSPKQEQSGAQRSAHERVPPSLPPSVVPPLLQHRQAEPALGGDVSFSPSGAPLSRVLPPPPPPQSRQAEPQQVKGKSEGSKKYGREKSNLFRAGINEYLEEGTVLNLVDVANLASKASRAALPPKVIELGKPFAVPIRRCPVQSNFVKFGNSLIMSHNGDKQAFVESFETHLETPDSVSTEMIAGLLEAASSKDVGGVFATLAQHGSKWSMVLPLLPLELPKSVVLHVAQEKGGGHTLCTDPNGSSVIPRAISRAAGFPDNCVLGYDVVPFSFDFEMTNIQWLILCGDCRQTSAGFAVRPKKAEWSPSAHALPLGPVCLQCRIRFDRALFLLSFQLAVYLCLLAAAGVCRVLPVEWGRSAQVVFDSMKREHTWMRKVPLEIVDMRPCKPCHFNAPSFVKTLDLLEQQLLAVKGAYDVICHWKLDDVSRTPMSWEEVLAVFGMLHFGYRRDRFGVRLFTDGANKCFTAETDLLEMLSRTHFKRLKQNQEELTAADVEASLWRLQESVGREEALRDLLEASEHELTVEFTTSRFPKYRSRAMPSYGDAGRIFSKLRKHPARGTSGRESKTPTFQMVSSALSGFRNVTGTMPQLFQAAVRDRNKTTVFNAISGDLLGWNRHFDGIQVASSEDRDFGLTLAFSPEPKVGTWFLVTNHWKISDGRMWVKVCDALVAHDRVIRRFVPQFVEEFGVPLLAFSRSLPANGSFSGWILLVFLVAVFVLAQNGASDTGAPLKHRGFKSERVWAVNADEILRAFDDFLVFFLRQFKGDIKEALVDRDFFEKFNLESFRKFCVKTRPRSRLGGAASLKEDDGKAWKDYRQALGFAGRAIFESTEQQHALMFWCSFCGVTVDEIAVFMEEKCLFFPKDLHQPPTPVVIDDTVFESTSIHFAEFVAKVEKVHRENVEKEKEKTKQSEAAESKREETKPKFDARVEGSKFAKKGKFLVPMPVAQMEEDFEDWRPGDGAQFSADDDKNLPWDDQQEPPVKKKQIEWLEANAVIEMQDQKSLYAAESDMEELEEDVETSGLKKEKKKPVNRRKGPSKGVRDTAKLDSFDGDDFAVKFMSKKSTEKYFVEDMGSVSGMYGFWDEAVKRRSDVAFAIEVTNVFRQEVCLYSHLGNLYVDILLGAARDICCNDLFACLPILSNAFWTVMCQDSLAPMLTRVGNFAGHDSINLAPAGGGQKHALFARVADIESGKHALMQLSSLFRDLIVKSGEHDSGLMQRFIHSVARSKGNSANTAFGNLVGSMLRRGFMVNTRTLIVAIIRNVIVEEECFGDDNFAWSARDIECLLCGVKLRSEIPENGDDDEDYTAQCAEEDLIKGDAVNLPTVSNVVNVVVERVRRILSGGALMFNRKTHYFERASEHVAIGSVMKRARELEELFKEICERDLWGGFNWCPTRRKQWRLGISSSDLQGCDFFSGLRQRLGSPFCLTWTDVVESCSMLKPQPVKVDVEGASASVVDKNGAVIVECVLETPLFITPGYEECATFRLSKLRDWKYVKRGSIIRVGEVEIIVTNVQTKSEKHFSREVSFVSGTVENRFLLVEGLVIESKEWAFERCARILMGLGDRNTQVLSDGESLKLRIKKDRSVEQRECLDWRKAPDKVRGLSRLCMTLDRELHLEEAGFMKCLEQTVARRRVDVKDPDSDVDKVFDVEELWLECEGWAVRNGIDFKSAFARVLQSDSASGDTLRKSQLCAQLPAAVACRLFTPKLLSEIVVFCFDFGLVKWIGGGVMLPGGKDADPCGHRVFQPYTVRGGEYHHVIGANEARARRERHGPHDFFLEAKLRRALECGKRRLWQKILRDMRKIADTASPGLDFMIIVGDGGIGSGRGHRKPASKEFLKFLHEFAFVVEMPENNTSKLCPRCWHETDFFWDVHKRTSRSNRTEIRTKFCSECAASPLEESKVLSKGFAYDRDTGAGVNFFAIFYSMVHGWGRPSQFEKKIKGVVKLSPVAQKKH